MLLSGSNRAHAEACGLAQSEPHEFGAQDEQDTRRGRRDGPRVHGLWRAGHIQRDIHAQFEAVRALPRRRRGPPRLHGGTIQLPGGQRLRHLRREP
jgi:hypothetical protein